MESLHALPHGTWRMLSIVEILCGLALILPVFIKTTGKFIPLAAFIFAAEMLLYIIWHLSSGVEDNGPVIYWLVVAVFSLFIAYGLLALRPIRKG